MIHILSCSSTLTTHLFATKIHFMQQISSFDQKFKNKCSTLCNKSEYFAQNKFFCPCLFIFPHFCSFSPIFVHFPNFSPLFPYFFLKIFWLSNFMQHFDVFRKKQCCKKLNENFQKNKRKNGEKLGQTNKNGPKWIKMGKKIYF